MLEEYDDILTVKDVLKILKIGMNTLYKLLNSGELYGKKIKRIWRIPKTSVIEYISKKDKEKC